LILTLLTRLFSRLEAMIQLWQSGQLPPPTPQEPRAIHPRERSNSHVPRHRQPRHAAPAPPIAVYPPMPSPHLCGASSVARGYGTHTPKPPLNLSASLPLCESCCLPAASPRHTRAPPSKIALREPSRSHVIFVAISK
jgi:hypothetical protein